MVEITGLRLAPSAAMKEKRLAALLAGRDAAADPALAEALVTAQVRGSLELAGKAGTPEEADAAAALRRAVFPVDAQAPLTVTAILTRQAALRAAHRMRGAGSRRAILVGGDAGRLEEALQASFQLQTEPLARLLDDAGERALDVLIGALS